MTDISGARSERLKKTILALETLRCSATCTIYGKGAYSAGLQSRILLNRLYDCNILN